MSRLTSAVLASTVVRAGPMAKAYIHLSSLQAWPRPVPQVAARRHRHRLPSAGQQSPAVLPLRAAARASQLQGQQPPVEWPLPLGWPHGWRPQARRLQGPHRRRLRLQAAPLQPAPASSSEPQWAG